MLESKMTIPTFSENKKETKKPKMVFSLSKSRRKLFFSGMYFWYKKNHIALTIMNNFQ